MILSRMALAVLGSSILNGRGSGVDVEVARLVLVTLTKFGPGWAT